MLTTELQPLRLKQHSAILALSSPRYKVLSLNLEKPKTRLRVIPTSTTEILLKLKKSSLQKGSLIKSPISLKKKTHNELSFFFFIYFRIRLIATRSVEVIRTFAQLMFSHTTVFLKRKELLL